MVLADHDCGLSSVFVVCVSDAASCLMTISHSLLAVIMAITKDQANNNIMDDISRNIGTFELL
jgi:hypothetical protein